MEKDYKLAYNELVSDIKDLVNATEPESWKKWMQNIEGLKAILTVEEIKKLVDKN